MDRLFDLDEALQSEHPKTDSHSAAKIIKFEQMHFEKVASLKQLLGNIPSPGEIYFLWTLKSFNAFTFITYIIKYFGVIEELVFSTYAINERILLALIRCYDKGTIKSVHVCISDSIRSRVPKVNDQLQSYATDRNITIGYAWNHSKVTLIKTAEHHFVVCGSGNFSENAMNEQYVFLNNELTYKFYYDCITKSIH